MNKKWNVHHTSLEKANEISKKYNLSNLVSEVLAQKEYLEVDDIEKFLNPTRNDFHDPFLMPDMNKAVDRIKKALETNEKICIYGDYDVDGITSTTLLKRFFKSLGKDVRSIYS